MADREALIARKHALRRRIEQLQREVAQARSRDITPARQIRQLEDQLERLMGEEYTLRMAIDRSPANG